MKQIDNRQKQQTLMRAKKAFLGGKNPAQPKGREKGFAPHAPAGPPHAEGAGGESSAAPAEPAAAAPVQPQPPKAGRNDPCPCGSGKKYKKCCLK